MRTRMKGFTLVEILIVVVILGILAAIVVPQFTNASNEAVKGALSSQLQTINSQVELYRVRNQGAYPNFSGDANFGWNALVGGEYLKEAPRNGYTRSATIDAVEELGAPGSETRNSGRGWAWFENMSTVYAVGFNPSTNLLAHEDGYETYVPGADIDEVEDDD